MTYRESDDREPGNVASEPERDSSGAPVRRSLGEGGSSCHKESEGGADPIRRYLVEAARTPLLDKDGERLLAIRMARRRAMFQGAATAIPAVWGPLVRLVRSALVGATPPSKVFALGGVSESAFHRHLKAAAELAARLEEIRRALCGDVPVLRPVRRSSTLGESGGGSAIPERREGGCRGHPNHRALLREGRELAVALNIRIAPLRRLVSQAAMELPAKKKGPVLRSANREGREGGCPDCARRIGGARRLFEAFVETRNILVSANLRLVVHIAKQVARHPSQLLDLIQEGNVGLLYATEKYDAREVCQFHSYAFWWIKQSMTRAIAGKSRLIRQPVNLAEAPARTREAVRKFRDDAGRDPTADELAGELDITRHQAQRLFRASVRTYSLDQMAGPEGGEGPLSDRLPDPRPPEVNLDADWISGGLEEVLTTLTPREREVVALRFGLGHHQNYTLENIARIYNLSRERVRQIEIKALGKLREPGRARRLRELLEALED